MASAIAFPARRRPTRDPLRRWSLLLVAYGSAGPAGAAAEQAAVLRAKGRFAAVDDCALHGPATLEVALEGLPPGPSLLLPFLMAEGHTLDHLERRLREHPSGLLCAVGRPLGTLPGLAEVMAQRAAAICAGRRWLPGETGLLLVGHGARRHAASGASLRRQAARLADLGGFAEVATAFLEQAPGVVEAAAAMTARHRLALGFFADAGRHAGHDLPARLAETAGGIVYAGPVGQDEALAELLLREAEQTIGSASRAHDLERP
ncbi:CbiX protein [Tistlia consotensis]|uniref:CbiX protein n=1 Tax=Tistlia consotensis USBA 355 TaxID=560819 RepID=A0A1Y6C4A2_9PROT|nr:CbiX/SirB N-terminal domain-containing protein [Tistlia consotensis]SMF36291.1 CbiX protein [Tistlia consotensis USBA 355]SNR71687.1 CbiX protein [Tistlia consotensis]